VSSSRLSKRVERLAMTELLCVLAGVMAAGWSIHEAAVFYSCTLCGYKPTISQIMA